VGCGEDGYAGRGARSNDVEAWTTGFITLHWGPSSFVLVARFTEFDSCAVRLSQCDSVPRTSSTVRPLPLTKYHSRDGSMMIKAVRMCSWHITPASSNRQEFVQCPCEHDSTSFPAC
jgi:hypothetical protein